MTSQFGPGRLLLAALMLVMAYSACRREPACFRIPAPPGPPLEIPDDVPKTKFEAFVFANPPNEFEALIAATETLCGKAQHPTTPNTELYRVVFRETWDTPRDLPLETSRATSLTMHQDDIILEVRSHRGAAGNYLAYNFYRDADLAGTKDIHIEAPSGSK